MRYVCVMCVSMADGWFAVHHAVARHSPAIRRQLASLPHWCPHCHDRSMPGQVTPDGPASFYPRSFDATGREPSAGTHRPSLSSSSITESTASASSVRVVDPPLLGCCSTFLDQMLDRTRCVCQLGYCWDWGLDPCAWSFRSPD